MLNNLNHYKTVLRDYFLRVVYVKPIRGKNNFWRSVQFNDYLKTIILNYNALTFNRLKLI